LCRRSTYLWDTIVAGILECENDKHQQCAGNELGEELVGLSKKRLRICAEDGRSSILRGRHCSKTVLKVIDRGYVIGINNPTANESTKELRNKVYRESPPWELSEQTVAESDGRIEVRSRVASDI
jgi:hypothetical protein